MSDFAEDGYFNDLRDELGAGLTMQNPAPIEADKELSELMRFYGIDKRPSLKAALLAWRDKHIGAALEKVYKYYPSFGDIEKAVKAKDVDALFGYIETMDTDLAMACHHYEIKFHAPTSNGAKDEPIS